MEIGKNPPALETRPVFQEWMMEYWSAYSVLSSRRDIGEYPSPIKISEIKAYMGIYESYDPDLLVRCVCAMDDLYLSKQMEKK